MIKTKSKTGSKVIVTCSICGRQLTRAGLVGHMRFKHGRDWKAPMISVEKPLNLIEARQAISHIGNFILPSTPCCQATFKLASGGTFFWTWRCPSCGSLWKESAGKVSIQKGGDIGEKDNRDYVSIELGLERQP